MIRILEPTEKRDFQRIPMDVRASVTGEGAFIACTISNVANIGAKVRLLAEPDYLQIAEGAEICLNVPELAEIFGRVIWIEDGYLGIQFYESHQVTGYLH